MTALHRISRLWLASLLLLGQVLGAPALRPMPCGPGASAPCCCLAGDVAEEPGATARHSCCGDEEPATPAPADPRQPGPCGCELRPVPAPLPAPEPLPRVELQAAVLPVPVARPALDLAPVSAVRPAPEPVARAGPPLHVRYCVFLD